MSLDWDQFQFVSPSSEIISDTFLNSKKPPTQFTKLNDINIPQSIKSGSILSQFQWCIQTISDSSQSIDGLKIEDAILRLVSDSNIQPYLYKLCQLISSDNSDHIITSMIFETAWEQYKTTLSTTILAFLAIQYPNVLIPCILRMRTRIPSLSLTIHYISQFSKNSLETSSIEFLKNITDSLNFEELSSFGQILTQEPWMLECIIKQLGPSSTFSDKVGILNNIEIILSKAPNEKLEQIVANPDPIVMVIEKIPDLSFIFVDLVLFIDYFTQNLNLVIQKLASNILEKLFQTLFYRFLLQLVSTSASSGPLSSVSNEFNIVKEILSNTSNSSFQNAWELVSILLQSDTFHSQLLSRNYIDLLFFIKSIKEKFNNGTIDNSRSAELQRFYTSEQLTSFYNVSIYFQPLTKPKSKMSFSQLIYFFKFISNHIGNDNFDYYKDPSEFTSEELSNFLENFKSIINHDEKDDEQVLAPSEIQKLCNCFPIRWLLVLMNVSTFSIMCQASSLLEDIFTHLNLSYKCSIIDQVLSFLKFIKNISPSSYSNCEVSEDKIQKSQVSSPLEKFVVTKSLFIHLINSDTSTVPYFIISSFSELLNTTLENTNQLTEIIQTNSNNSTENNSMDVATNEEIDESSKKKRSRESNSTLDYIPESKRFFHPSMVVKCDYCDSYLLSLYYSILPSNSGSISYLTNCLLSLVDSRFPSPTNEQYNQILPKKSTFDRDIFIEQIFRKYPVLWDILKMISITPSELKRCTNILRSLFVNSIGNWHAEMSSNLQLLPSLSNPMVNYGGLVSEDYAYESANFFGYNSTMIILNLLEQSGWLPKSIAGIQGMFVYCKPNEICYVLLSLWDVLCETTFSEQVTWVENEDTVNKSKEAIRSVLRKHISVLPDSALYLYLRLS